MFLLLFQRDAVRMDGSRHSRVPPTCGRAWGNKAEAARKFRMRNGSTPEGDVGCGGCGCKVDANPLARRGEPAEPAIGERADGLTALNPRLFVAT